MEYIFPSYHFLSICILRSEWISFRQYIYMGLDFVSIQPAFWPSLLLWIIFHVVCLSSVQFSHSVMSNSFDPMDYTMPGFQVYHQPLEFTHTHVHKVSVALQQSNPLLTTSPAFYLSQYQGLSQWFSSSHQVAKVLEFQHQYFRWIFRTDLL